MPPTETGRPRRARCFPRASVLREPVGVGACNHTVQLSDDELRRQDRTRARLRQHGRGESRRRKTRSRRRALPHRRLGAAAGVVNFVNGLGAGVGEALFASDSFDMISFTGSTAVGTRIQETAARRMKRR